MKKIFMVSSNLPPKYSGAGRRVYNQAQYLAQKGYDVTILTRTSNYLKMEDVKVIVWEGIYSTSESRTGKLFFNLMNYPKNIFWVARYLRLNNYDVIHCIGLSSWMSLFTILAGKMNNNKIIAEITLLGSDDHRSIRKTKFGRIKQRIINSADMVVPISPALEKISLNAGVSPDKIKVINNGVDTIIFYPPSIDEKKSIKEKLGFSLNNPIFITVGALNKRKRPDLIIDCFYQLSNVWKDSCLLIVGIISEKNKEYISYVEEKIKQYGLNGRVILTGNVQNLDDYLKISDVFLFASDSEGFPNAIIEAMSTGIPVVSFNIPLITEAIISSQYDGIVVENVDELVEQTIQLLNDEEKYRYISRNARKKVESSFSDDIIMSQYIKIYNSL